MSDLPGWPATLADGRVTLRPFRGRDAAAWSEVRLTNEEWLTPWEPLAPGYYDERNSAAAFSPMLRALRKQARAGQTMPFSIWWDRTRYAGQLTVGNIVRGSLNGGYLGYWVDRRLAGRGIMPTAVALAVDHCFTAGGLHRVECNIRPENDASRRVVEKLGFREEGLRRRYLYIDGAWRDHVHYALTVEDVPEGCLRRWRSVSRTHEVPRAT